MDVDHIGIMHEFRKDIDACIKKVAMYKGEGSVYNFQHGQRELALVYTKLQEAKMWAGKVLEELGSPFPEELRDEAK